MYLHLTPVGRARRRFIIKMAMEIRWREERLTGQGREEGKIAWEELQSSSYRVKAGRPTWLQEGLS